MARIGVEAHRGRRPGGCYHAARHEAGVPVGAHCLLQCRRVHPEGFVDRDEANEGAGEARDPGTFLSGRMGLRRGVDAELGECGAGLRRTLASGEQCAEGGGRGAVLDHATALPLRTEASGEPEQLDEPVQHDHLDLGAGGARRPEHPVDAQAGRDQFAEDRRRRRVGREVAKETGRLPVRSPRHHDPVKIGEKSLERLGLLRRISRQHRRDLARSRGREHRVALEPREVVGHPVDGLPTVAPQVLRGNQESVPLGHPAILGAAAG